MLHTYFAESKKGARALKKIDMLIPINDGAYSGQFFPPSLKGNNTPPALKTFDPKSDLFVTDLHAWTY